MINEHDYIKKVGWRLIRDIRNVRSEPGLDILEGYYLRHARYIFEEGYQKVRVRCVIDSLDNHWKVWHVHA